MDSLLIAAAIFCVFIYAEWGEIYKPYALGELIVILGMLVFAAFVYK